MRPSKKPYALGANGAPHSGPTPVNQGQNASDLHSGHGRFHARGTAGFADVYIKLYARVLRLEATDKIATTIITYEEQTRGWLAFIAKSRKTPHLIKSYSRLKKHLFAYQNFEVL